MNKGVFSFCANSGHDFLDRADIPIEKKNHVYVTFQCDGQVLVMQDLLGMNDGFAPKIMRRFADAGSVMEKGFADYAAAVRSGAFPTVENSFPKSDCSDAFLQTLAEKIAD